MNTIHSALLALAIGAGSVHAATDTTFDVRLTIESTCDIQAAAATDVDFGTQVSTATNVDAAGQLVVNCTPLTAYEIALDDGSNGSGINDRNMSNGSALVPYQLYRDAGRTQVWGETTGIGGNTFAGSGTGANQNVPVYGRVPSANFPAGNYVDTITATITY